MLNKCDKHRIEYDWTDCPVCEVEEQKECIIQRFINLQVRYNALKEQINESS